jgi:hypothetical protein
VRERGGPTRAPAARPASASIVVAANTSFHENGAVRHCTTLNVMRFSPYVGSSSLRRQGQMRATPHNRDCSLERNVSPSTCSLPIRARLHGAGLRRGPRNPGGASIV